MRIFIDLSLETNRTDICDQISNGLIDTAFTYKSDLSFYSYYVLKGENFWELSDDLKSIISKIPKKLSKKWILRNLKDIEMVFSLNPSVFNELGNPTYFIKVLIKINFL
jgi:hypothetical protein